MFIWIQQTAMPRLTWRQNAKPWSESLTVDQTNPPAGKIATGYWTGLIRSSGEKIYAKEAETGPLYRLGSHQLPSHNLVLPISVLACRAAGSVHLLPAQAVLLFRGGRHDRGRPAPLHRPGGAEELCRQPRAKRFGLRLLPSARIRPDAAEGHC